MKNRITYVILLLFLALSTTSLAQIFGVKAGMNLSNLSVKDEYDSYSDNFKMKPGFHIGPTIEFQINETFTFESGLLLSTKGTKMSDKEKYQDNTYEFSSKANLYYLDIPITAKAVTDVGSSRIFATFGPYIGVGLSGKMKSEYTQNGKTGTDESDINFGPDEEEDDLKRLDYGLIAGAGIEFNAIQVGITYSLGLANISTYTDDGDKVKSRVLGISLAYKFGN